MIRKMRGGQLQMGAFTMVGLETISKEMSALAIPLLFQTLRRARLRARQTQRAPREGAGRHGASSSSTGARRAGSSTSRRSRFPNLKALQALKLFVWSGSSEAEEMYKDAGFKIEPAAPTDILMYLQRGRIEAFPAPATLALANQWFGLAKNMMDIKFAPVVGATIITKAAWDTIDPKLRPALLTMARETGAKYTPKIRGARDRGHRRDGQAGLQIQKLTPQAEAEWQQTAEKFYPKIRGTMVPADLFDEVRRLVVEYRAQKKAEPASRPGPPRSSTRRRRRRRSRSRCRHGATASARVARVPRLRERRRASSPSSRWRSCQSPRCSAAGSWDRACPVRSRGCST